MRSSSSSSYILAANFALSSASFYNLFLSASSKAYFSLRNQSSPSFLSFYNLASSLCYSASLIFLNLSASAIAYLI
jgi:hypothetical protein